MSIQLLFGLASIALFVFGYFVGKQIGKIEGENNTRMDYEDYIRKLASARYADNRRYRAERKRFGK